MASRTRAFLRVSERRPGRRAAEHRGPRRPSRGENHPQQQSTVPADQLGDHGTGVVPPCSLARPGGRAAGFFWTLQRDCSSGRTAELETVVPCRPEPNNNPLDPPAHEARHVGLLLLIDERVIRHYPYQKTSTQPCARPDGAETAPRPRGAIQCGALLNLVSSSDLRREGEERRETVRHTLM